MSVETEKWMRSHDSVWVDEPGREHVAECASVERAKQVQVLPEALALLKRVRNGYVGVEEVDDVLRRAGVLSA